MELGEAAWLHPVTRGLVPSPTPEDQLDSGRPARQPCSLPSSGQRLAQGAQQGDQVPRPHTGSLAP